MYRNIIAYQERSNCIVYEPVELTFSAAADDFGKDINASLKIVFTHADGEEIEGEGFWDGADVWRVRFSPLKEGVYEWKTMSSDKALDGQAGQLIAAGTDSDNIFLRHGPLKISKNKRHFEHDDGEPFFWLGEGLWAVAQQSVEGELDKYFNKRKAQGFNVVQFNSLLNWESTTPYRREPFLKAEGKDDFNLYNISYFQYLDIIFEKCAINGMVAAPVVLWFNYAPGKKQDWYDPPYEWPVFTEGQARRLGSYLGARFGAYPVAWLISADISDNDPEAMRIFSAATEGILAASFYIPPISSHIAAKSAYHPGMAQKNWTTFHFIQSGHRKDGIGFPAAYSRAVRRQCKEQPVINGEMFFEGLGFTRTNERIPLATIRRAAWESLLAGANAGISYGAHGMWCWYDEKLEFRMEKLWLSPTPWQKAIDFPGPAIYTNIKNFIKALPWYEYEEAQDLVIHEEGKEPATACRLGNEEFILVYVPDHRHLRLTQLSLENKPAYWFDPISAMEEQAVVKLTQGGVGVTSPSWDHDAVLKIGPLDHK